MNLYKKENIAILKDVPVLTDGQIYLYAIQNAPQNNIPYNLVKNGINAIGSTSLYTRIGEDQETDLLDCLADHDTNVEKEAISNLYSDSVIDSISDCLSERELAVIKKRMGYGCEHMTLEMVGAELGVTRERIRQIENSAFKKIHRRLGCRPALKQALRDDLDMYAQKEEI